MSMKAPLVLQGFSFAKKIGSGSYGEVYLAIQEATNIKFAIKCICRNKLKSSNSENLITEISILKRIKHPNIIHMMDFKWNSIYIYIITELCEYGDLSGLLKKLGTLSENLIQLCANQIMSAYKYLNSMQISHFDLKPSNILVKYFDNELLILKIADFGLAKCLLEANIVNNIRGTYLYMAPEILNHKKYDAKADLWSIGVILYECYYGATLYPNKSIDGLIKDICSSQPILIPTTKPITYWFKDLLLKLLQKDPKLRISFTSFFMHPFVTYNSLDTKLQKKLIIQSALINTEYYLENGSAAERKKDLAEAVLNYANAANVLSSIIHLEKSNERRDHMREFIDDLFEKANTLKLSKTSIKYPHTEQNDTCTQQKSIDSNDFDISLFKKHFCHDKEIMSSIMLSDAAKLLVPNLTSASTNALKNALYKYNLCIEVLFRKMNHITNAIQQKQQYSNAIDEFNNPVKMETLKKEVTSLYQDNELLLVLLDEWRRQADLVQLALQMQEYKVNRALNKYSQTPLSTPNKANKANGVGDNSKSINNNNNKSNSLSMSPLINFNASSKLRIQFLEDLFISNKQNTHVEPSTPIKEKIQPLYSSSPVANKCNSTDIIDNSSHVTPHLPKKQEKCIIT